MSRAGLAASAAAMTLLAACARTSGADGGAAGPGADPAKTPAWVGEDAARGLRVVLEALPAPAHPQQAHVGEAEALPAALDLSRAEQLFRVHVLAAEPAPGSAPAAWGNGSALRSPGLREDASARQRLLYQALVGGGSAPQAPYRYLLAGSGPADAADAAEWRGVAPPLPLLPRRWTPAERAAFLDGAAAPPPSDE